MPSLTPCTERSPDHPFQGNKGRKHEGNDPDEGDGEEDIVHGGQGLLSEVQIALRIALQTASCDVAADEIAGRHYSSDEVKAGNYWQGWRRPSSPLIQLPGVQAMPLREE